LRITTETPSTYGESKEKKDRTFWESIPSKFKGLHKNLVEKYEEKIYNNYCLIVNSHEKTLKEKKCINLSVKFAAAKYDEECIFDVFLKKLLEENSRCDTYVLILLQLKINQFLTQVFV
jgi:hypothetical protein